MLDSERILNSNTFMQPGERIRIHIPENEEYVPPHKHDYIEMNYVCSGSFEQIIEGKKIISNAGDVCIFDTQAIHSVRCLLKDSVLVNILTRKEFFDGMFLVRMNQQGVVSAFLVNAVLQNRSKEHFLFFPVGENKKIRSIIESLREEDTQKDIGYEDVLESEMIILFTELLRFYRNQNHSVGKGNKHVDESCSVVTILTFIEEHVDNCTLKNTAAYFGFHPNYLTSLLKRKTGYGFLTHVHEQRLKRAKLYLKNSELPVTEIISLCGYHNLPFFYKMFREAEGCTPSEYRNRLEMVKNL